MEFELSREMIENELIIIFTSSKEFGNYVESTLLSNFVKRIMDSKLREHWYEKMSQKCGVSEIYSFDLFETPFGVYAMVEWVDRERIVCAGVYQLTNNRGKCFRSIPDTRHRWLY